MPLAFDILFVYCSLYRVVHLGFQKEGILLVIFNISTATKINRGSLGEHDFQTRHSPCF